MVYHKAYSTQNVKFKLIWAWSSEQRRENGGGRGGKTGAGWRWGGEGVRGAVSVKGNEGGVREFTDVPSHKAMNQICVVHRWNPNIASLFISAKSNSKSTSTEKLAFERFRFLHRHAIDAEQVRSASPAGRASRHRCKHIYRYLSKTIHNPQTINRQYIGNLQ